MLLFAVAPPSLQDAAFTAAVNRDTSNMMMIYTIFNVINETCRCLSEREVMYSIENQGSDAESAAIVKELEDRELSSWIHGAESTPKE